MAVEWCQAKGWSIGTKLKSREWSGTQELVKIGERYIWLRCLHRTERVRSLPQDVTVAE